MLKYAQGSYFSGFTVYDFFFSSKEQIASNILFSPSAGVSKLLHVVKNKNLIYFSMPL